MTAPILVRRRWHPTEAVFGPWARSRFALDQPWVWRCQETRCVHTAFDVAPTQPEALAAGLAHLATHTETT